jgi:hypothetical protein
MAATESSAASRRVVVVVIYFLHLGWPGGSLLEAVPARECDRV